MTDKDKLILAIAMKVIDHYNETFDIPKLKVITDTYISEVEKLINAKYMDQLIQEFKKVDIHV